MKKLSVENSNINASLAISLLFHMAAFGAAAAMHARAPYSVVNEYMPVELVELPPASRYVAAAPAAVAPWSAQPAMAQEKTKATPATVAQPVAVQPLQPIIAPVAAPAAGPTIPTRASATVVSGATGGQQPSAAATSAPSSRPGTGSQQPVKRGRRDYLAFHRLTRLPSFRLRSEPVYPNAERMSGGEARVLAEIYLDERGAVDEVVIKKSGGPLFDKAVMDAVRQSIFHPGQMGEKAVPTVIQIPYTFKLR